MFLMTFVRVRVSEGGGKGSSSQKPGWGRGDRASREGRGWGGHKRVFV